MGLSNKKLPQLDLFIFGFFLFQEPTNEDDSGVEVEYVSEKIDLPKWDPSYAAFQKIFEAFKVIYKHPA